MYYNIINKNDLLHNRNILKYRKTECPYPKGIILRRRHLWNKEKYLAPYRFEMRKTLAETDYNDLW